MNPGPACSAGQFCPGGEACPDSLQCPDYVSCDPSQTNPPQFCRDGSQCPASGFCRNTGAALATAPALLATEDANLSVATPWCETGPLVMEDVCAQEHGADSVPHSDPSLGDECWSCAPGGGVDLKAYVESGVKGSACCLVNKGNTPEAKCYGWEIAWRTNFNTGEANPDCL